MNFEYGSKNSPHKDKIYKGGEDAMITSDKLLIVADGVGGWAMRGVDAVLYSKKLVQFYKE